MRRIVSEGLPHNPADPANFVLPATMQRLLGRDDGESVRLYRVTFEEGADIFPDEYNTTVGLLKLPFAIPKFSLEKSTKQPE